MTLPGLSESLGNDNIVKDYIDISNVLEISGKVENFEMESVMISVNNELGNISDSKKDSNSDYDLSEVVDNVDKIEDSSLKLRDG